MRHAIVDSPIDPLTIVGDGDVLTGLFMRLHRAGARRGTETCPVPIGERDDRVLPAVRAQLEAYFAGDLTEFDLPLGAVGTPFQQAVWAGLRQIPYGETATYGQLAARIGRPAAVRAVGLANGRNPISIVVPCHRVIGADGSLTGFGGGLERKRFLLELEGSPQLARAPRLW